MKNQFNELLAFLDRLDQAKITYSLERSRDDALQVSVVVPGEYWEIEFLTDGEVEVERFVSAEGVHDESMLKDFFTRYVDPEIEAFVPATQEPALARN